METNLAYAGGGDNTYGDTIATGATTSTLNVINSASVSGAQDDNTCHYSSSRACVYTAVPGSNRTSAFTNTDPSTSTTGTGQYGYLYNWCAAMGIQPSACQANTATQPNPSPNPGGNTIYNICPAGWRLPTGGSGGEFESLISALGWVSGGPRPLLTNGLLMYAGSWYLGSFYGNQGATGYGWSSTVKDATLANILYFTSAGATNPTNYTLKQSGFAVRCVAP